MSLGRILAVAVLVTSLACSKPTSSPAAVHAPTSKPSRYFPLALGNSWTYDVTIQTRSLPAAIRMNVTDVDNSASAQGGTTYVLSILDTSLAPEDRPDEPVLYQVREGLGLYCVKCEGYILREPLVLSNRWPAGIAEGTDGTYRITDTTRTVRTPISTWNGCLTVEKTETTFDRRILTVYCLDVGPTLVRYFAVAADSPLQREETLVRYTIRDTVPSRGN